MFGSAFDVPHKCGNSSLPSRQDIMELQNSYSGRHSPLLHRNVCSGHLWSYSFFIINYIDAKTFSHYLPSWFQWITSHFIFSVTALLLTIAKRSTRYTFPTHLTMEWFARTFSIWSITFLVQRTLFVWCVIAIWSSITNEIPTDAYAAGATLKCPGRASCSFIVTHCFIWLMNTITSLLLVTVCVRISKLAWFIRITWQSQWDWTIA